MREEQEEVQEEQEIQSLKEQTNLNTQGENNMTIRTHSWHPLYQGTKEIEAKPAANFHCCRLDDMDLRGLDLRGADFEDATLYRTDLRGADLRGANFLRARMDGANIDGADLRGAILYEKCVNGGTVAVPLGLVEGTPILDSENLKYWNQQKQ